MDNPTPNQSKETLSYTIDTALNDDRAVGIVSDVTLGDQTIIEQDARGLFRCAHPSGLNAERPTYLLIACNGGEVTVETEPKDAPLETWIKTEYYQLALNELSTDGQISRPQFDLWFDDAGPVIFRTPEKAVAIAPVEFGVVPSTTRQPTGPSGPSV